MAIIGVAGRIGSGKDLTGKVIQYLTGTGGSNDSEIPSFRINEDYTNFSDWQIKKYADKLKQVVSILTGIPVEDLEKEEVKNSYLGEEWIRYGYADSFYRDKDGNPIMNNKQCSKEEYEIHLKTNWQTAYKHQYTVREVLQLVGTEAIRNVIHENAWINALMSEYDNAPKKLDRSNFASKRVPLYDWIITDVRYPNEAKAIKDRDGFIIRVEKISTVEAGIKVHEEIESKVTGLHSSETSLDDWKFDYTISAKHGDIDSLIQQVKEILIKEKII